MRRAQDDGDLLSLLWVGRTPVIAQDDSGLPHAFCSRVKTGQRSSGLLLCQAMQRPKTQHQIDGMHTHDVALLEEFSEQP